MAWERGNRLAIEGKWESEAAGSLLDTAFLQRRAGSEQFDYPAGLSTASRPCFRENIRISKFRKDRRVRPRLRKIRWRSAKSAAEFRQSSFYFQLLSFDFRGQDSSDLGVEIPKIIEWHRLQIGMFHSNLPVSVSEPSCGPQP
jgi:hypothetical protein